MAATPQIVFNPFTGTFDYIGSNTDGFSWYNIPVGGTVTIDNNREMVTTSPQTVLGTLTILGRNTVL